MPDSSSLDVYAQTKAQRPHPVVEFGAIALGGAFGALTRWSMAFWVGEAMRPLSAVGALITGTLFVNWIGAFALGALLGILDRQGPHPLIRPFLAVGFLGSFTTFSTFVLENQAFFGATPPNLFGAVAHAFGMIAGGLLAFAIGQKAVAGASAGADVKGATE